MYRERYILDREWERGVERNQRERARLVRTRAWWKLRGVQCSSAARGCYAILYSGCPLHAQALETLQWQDDRDMGSESAAGYKGKSCFVSDSNVQRQGETYGFGAFGLGVGQSATTGMRNLQIAWEEWQWRIWQLCNINHLVSKASA